MQEMTMGRLKAKLQALEKQWEEKNISEFMGPFNDQMVMAPVFEWNKPKRYDPDGAFDFKGYSPEVDVVFVFHTSLGFVIEPLSEQKDQKADRNLTTL